MNIQYKSSECKDYQIIKALIAELSTFTSTDSLHPDGT